MVGSWNHHPACIAGSISASVPPWSRLELLTVYIATIVTNSMFEFVWPRGICVAASMIQGDRGTYIANIDPMMPYD